MATSARSLAVAAMALAAVLSGCGHDGAPAKEAPSPSSAASSSAPAQALAPDKCEPQGEYQITITEGDISCANAYVLAARYDVKGEKSQTLESIDTWTCSTGTADTRPLIFSCVSNAGAEFAVYPGK